MSAISKVLRNTEDKGLVFWCPGCKTSHRIQYGEGTGPRWVWNGMVDKPTFTPSVLVRSGHYLSGREADSSCWCTYNKEHPEEDDPDFICVTCHSFVTDGRIRFLDDCTHDLKGQTVDLPEHWTVGID